RIVLRMQRDVLLGRDVEADAYGAEIRYARAHAEELETLPVATARGWPWPVLQVLGRIGQAVLQETGVIPRVRAMVTRVVEPPSQAREVMAARVEIVETLDEYLVFTPYDDAARRVTRP